MLQMRELSQGEEASARARQCGSPSSGPGTLLPPNLDPGCLGVWREDREEELHVSLLRKLATHPLKDQAKIRKPHPGSAADSRRLSVSSVKWASADTPMPRLLL